MECKLKNYLRSGTVASSVSKGMVNMMFDKTSSLQMVNRERASISQTKMDQTFSKQIKLRLFSNGNIIFSIRTLYIQKFQKKPFPNLKSFDTAKHQEIPPRAVIFWTPESFGNACLGCTNLQSSYSIESTYGLIEVRKTGDKSGENPWEF